MSEQKNDLRSALVLVEPVFAPGLVLWHGMAFVAGENVEEITGTDRTDVLTGCIASLGAVGVTTYAEDERFDD